MRLLMLVVLVGWSLAGPALALSCLETRPQRLADYVKELDRQYPVIVEGRFSDLKATGDGWELTLNVSHVWKGKLARGIDTVVHTYPLPTYPDLKTVADLGGRYQLHLLTLIEKDGKYHFHRACGASAPFPGTRMGTWSALYFALLFELDAHFGTDRFTRDDPLRSLTP